ncbi:efflux RND transporter permease subunit [Nostoc sp.]|uniref:efflux RND transporter permease subunit n=1 Tax=Nostoc sp. TaxID=1180 RepID=UPI002FF5D194
MTALAGILGFYPLVVASGAGAMSRWALGTALVGGYTFSTILSLFLVPVLYVVIKNLEDRFLRPGRPSKPGAGGDESPTQSTQNQEEVAAPTFNSKASLQGE